MALPAIEILLFKVVTPVTAKVEPIETVPVAVILAKLKSPLNNASPLTDNFMAGVVVPIPTRLLKLSTTKVLVSTLKSVAKVVVAFKVVSPVTANVLPKLAAPSINKVLEAEILP